MSGGLTATGLVIEVVDDIRTGMETETRSTFFKSLPLGDKTLLGHIEGLIARGMGLVWERMEQVNSSQDPDKATGPSLDAVSILTGTFRPLATKSTAVLTLCGSPGTTVAAGSIVATASTTQLFDTRDSAAFVTLNVWATSSAYVIGDRVSANSRCYQCIVAGTSSSGGGGPATTSTDITDGGAHWEYIGEGTAAVDVNADCEVTGPIVALSRDLTVIRTPVSGWASVLNLLDATVGQNEATDEELRLLRQLELAGSGATTKDALRSAILRLLNVISCTVFNNTTDATNGDGLPPHSFETLVRGGDTQEIVDTIGRNQPDGIATYSGNGTFGTFVDSEGNSQTIYYTRPTNVNVYLDVSVNYDATLYPSDGNTEVRDAILAWGNKFPTNRDVDPSAAGANAFTVPGVLGVTRVEVYNDVINGSPGAWAPTTAYVATVGARSVVLNDGGRAYICITAGTSAGSGGPTGTNTDITDGTVHWRFLGNIFVISTRQLAVFDSTRITIHSTPVTP